MAYILPDPGSRTGTAVSASVLSEKKRSPGVGRICPETAEGEEMGEVKIKYFCPKYLIFVPKGDKL